MDRKTEINKHIVAFSFWDNIDKLRYFNMLFSNIKDNRVLMGEVCQMAERAYHPMANIEKWMEGRLTKHPTFAPKRVISECVIAMKLNRQMEPLLWGLARTVKKRVTRRIAREAEKNV